MVTDKKKDLGNLQGTPAFSISDQKAFPEGCALILYPPHDLLPVHVGTQGVPVVGIEAFPFVQSLAQVAPFQGF